MSATTLTSREFNQAASRAKKAAEKGPVFISDRGRPAHVLLTYEHYIRLTANRHSLADVFGMPVGIEDVALTISPQNELARVAELD